jgi:hypothetical protein
MRFERRSPKRATNGPGAEERYRWDAYAAFGKWLCALTTQDDVVDAYVGRAPPDDAITTRRQPSRRRRCVLIGVPRDDARAVSSPPLQRELWAVGKDSPVRYRMRRGGLTAIVPRSLPRRCAWQSVCLPDAPPRSPLGSAPRLLARLQKTYRDGTGLGQRLSPAASRLGFSESYLEYRLASLDSYHSVYRSGFLRMTKNYSAGTSVHPRVHRALVPKIMAKVTPP